MSAPGLPVAVPAVPSFLSSLIALRSSSPSLLSLSFVELSEASFCSTLPGASSLAFSAGVVSGRACSTISFFLASLVASAASSSAVFLVGLDLSLAGSCLNS